MDNELPGQPQATQRSGKPIKSIRQVDPLNNNRKKR